MTAARTSAGVADDPEVDVAVLADGAVVEVDLHDGRVRRQPLAVAHAEVEGRADDDDDVGVGEGVPAGQLEVVRVAGRQGAAARAVHVGGHVERAYEVDRRLGAAASSRPGCPAGSPGFSACTSRSASFSIASGSPA